LFLRVLAEEQPANMCGNCEIDFVAVLPIFFFNYRMIYNQFCDVVCDQPRPNLLFYKISLAGMEIAGLDCIVRLPERCLNALYELSCKALTLRSEQFLHSVKMYKKNRTAHHLFGTQFCL